MSLPMLAELPAILLPFASRAEQSFRDTQWPRWMTIMAFLRGRRNGGDFAQILRRPWLCD